MNTKHNLYLLVTVVTTLIVMTSAHASQKLKALIIDGQNNHDVWPKSTVMMKQYLQETGMFKVDVERTKNVWKSEKYKDWLDKSGAGIAQPSQKPQPDPQFSPDFSHYDVVISNFGWNAAPLPAQTQKNFETYMAEGGALVVVHAANNSWPQWVEYNKMIGLGGWGGRNEKSGPYVYYNDAGKLIRDTSKGKGGSHGPKHEFVITTRDQEHPITRGLPAQWMHSKDECYSHMRGPAEHMTILATGCDTPASQKEGRHEPMLMVLSYGKGRVFHTMLGDNVPGFEGVGFIETFLRGAEWAATGKVTREIPKDFPTKQKSSSRLFKAITD